MKPEEVNNFREDISEDSIVTLLLYDQTQVSGRVVKIREYNVKVRLENVDGAPSMSVSFDDVQRWVEGFHDFVGQRRQSAPMAAPANPQAAASAAPVPQAAAAAKVENRVLAHVRELEKKLEAGEQPPMPEPKFVLTDVSLGAFDKRDINTVLAQLGKKYEAYKKSGSRAELADMTARLEKWAKKYETIPTLPTIYGLLCWQAGDVKTGIGAMMAAAYMGRSNACWKNLAQISGDNPDISWYAWHEYFNDPVIAINEACWLAYLRAAIGASALEATPRQILDISKKITSQDSLVLLGQTLLYIFNKNGHTKNLEQLAEILDDRVNIKARLAEFMQSGKDLPIFSDEEFRQRFSNIRDKISGGFYNFFDIQFNSPQANEKITYSSGITINLSQKIRQGRILDYSLDYDNGNVQDTVTNDIYPFRMQNVEAEAIRKALRGGGFSGSVFFELRMSKTNFRYADALRLERESSSSIKFENYSDVMEWENRAKKALQNGDREKAIQIYREAVAQPGLKKKPLLWLGLAQQLSAAKMAAEAAEAYRTLITIEPRESARKNARIQYAQLLAQAGKLDEAEKEARKLHAEFPDEMTLKVLLEKIRLYRQTMETSDADPAEMGISFKDISIFLKRDLETAQFFDSKIMAQNGQPAPEDARRLAKAANSGKTSNERHFLALQAAKAYNLLPVGSYDPQEYTKALSTYAMQKGVSLVERMLGMASSSDKVRENSSDIIKLSDSATSYFIESLSLMSEETEDDVVRYVIKNYLFAELFKFYALHPDKFDRKILHARNFNEIFQTMLSSQAEIFTIACKSFITWGSYPEVWRKLNRLTDGPGAFSSNMRRPKFTDKVKTSLENLFEIRISSTKPGEILNAGYDFIHEENKKLSDIFGKLLNMRQTGNFDYMRRIKRELDSFPLENKNLQESDRVMFKFIYEVIGEMMSYGNPEISYDEQNLILMQVGQKLGGEKKDKNRIKRENSLLDDIKDAPTYWKRSGWEPLIGNCLACIGEITNKRLAGLKPKLALLLEPPVFRRHGDFLRTTLRARNDSPISAMDARVELSVLGDDGKVIESQAIPLGMVKASSSDTEREIKIPVAIPEAGPLEGRKICLKAFFYGGESDDFYRTIEEEPEMVFDLRDIIWDPQGDVPEFRFKGRDDILRQMEDNLSLDADRGFSNMLYGVTRSGKTSILKFFRLRIQGKPVPNDRLNRRFFCFNWAFETYASVDSAEALWKKILKESVLEALEKPFNEASAEAAQLTEAVRQSIPADAASGQFPAFIRTLGQRGIYPVFLVDEFSYFKKLHARGFLGPDFLAILRELTLRKEAAFFFAGTYDILDMVKDPAYGITGQFANLRQLRVTSIKEDPARQLVNIYSEKLRFTEEAQDLILDLSDCRPSLIQYICQNCARFALNEKRRLLGVPEVRKVGQIMAELEPPTAGIQPVGETYFINNLIFPSDPRSATFGAITTLLAHSGDVGLGYNDIAYTWKDHGLQLADLAAGLTALCAREVIEERKPDGSGETTYRLKVKLFNWWWKNGHPFVDKELDAVSINN